VSGVKTLSLEVDFGRGQDVGDRVVWANPRLLRADAKPADAKPAGAKPVDAKQADAKPADAKPADAKK
jgi:hypothetical protein